jgi:hypothetical protein
MYYGELGTGIEPAERQFRSLQLGLNNCVFGPVQFATMAFRAIRMADVLREGTNPMPSGPPVRTACQRNRNPIEKIPTRSHCRLEGLFLFQETKARCVFRWKTKRS